MSIDLFPTCTDIQHIIAFYAKRTKEHDRLDEFLKLASGYDVSCLMERMQTSITILKFNAHFDKLIKTLTQLGLQSSTIQFRTLPSEYTIYVYGELKGIICFIVFFCVL